MWSMGVGGVGHIIRVESESETDREIVSGGREGAAVNVRRGDLARSLECARARFVSDRWPP